jgi:low affinity Fe/Cu permease
MEKRTEKEKQFRLQQTALAVTRWVGSPQSIFVHTTIFVIIIALLFLNVFPLDVLLLVFNTAVSLEAIYLALFIQMTVNYTTETIESVEQDIDEIQEDIDEMQEDVEEIQEDVDELQEDVEEMNEEESADEAEYQKEQRNLEKVHEGLQKLIRDVEKLQSKQ